MNSIQNLLDRGCTDAYEDDHVHTYAIAEIFFSIQGEGFYVGKPAVFVRFAGCNLWSGREEDRQKDSKVFGSRCPLFCDTDFSHKERLTSLELLGRIKKVGPGVKFVVLTGGEPALQYDEELDDLLCYEGYFVGMETNGTVPLKARPDFVTLSPKLDSVKIKDFDEIKVIYPTYEPLSYLPYVEEWHHLFIQPEDGPNLQGNILLCMTFLKEHPEWRLSIQTHKLLGVR